MATSYEDKKRANRLAQAKFRKTEHGKAYLKNWREENREKYNQYHKEYYHRKKQSNTVDAEN